MIVIQDERDLLKVNVYAELTLADYRELEQAITGRLKSEPKIKLLIDLTQMSGFTVDVAWEDIKFTKAHAHDFKRIAVASNDQWVSWLSWLSSAFTDADLKVFADADEASVWLHSD